MKIITNDTVKIMTGKDLGKEGKVLKVLPKESKVVVEGIGMVKKHVKPSGDDKGGIVEVERPVSLSNVMLVCPKCKKPTRVSYIMKDNKKNRFCKKCNTIIE